MINHLTQKELTRWASEEADKQGYPEGDLRHGAAVKAAKELASVWVAWAYELSPEALYMDTDAVKTILDAWAQRLATFMEK